MSKEAATEFLSKVESDPKVRQDVMKSVDDVVSAGARHGYNFSKDDLKGAMADKWKTPPSPPAHHMICVAYCCIYEEK